MDLLKNDPPVFLVKQPYLGEEDYPEPKESSSTSNQETLPCLRASSITYSQATLHRGR